MLHGMFPKASNWVFLCFQLGNFIFPTGKFYFSRHPFFNPFWGLFHRFVLFPPISVKIHALRIMKNNLSKTDRNVLFRIFRKRKKNEHLTGLHIEEYPINIINLKQTQRHDVEFL